MTRIQNSKLQSRSTPNKDPLSSSETNTDFVQLDPTQRSVKKLTDKGEYTRALDLLSDHTTDTQLLNSRGVCLLRLGKFAAAISPLRMAALNLGTMQVHQHIGTHIKVNFAIALFFGGFPAGGLSTLSEFEHADDDPGVTMLRKQARLWEQRMNLLQRLFWKLSLEPSVEPLPPEYPVGQFVWDVKVTK
jgi:hypothetical protein